MKLQVKGQSIRLRLTEADLAELLATGQCSDSTSLGAGHCWSRTLRLVEADTGFTREGESWRFAIPRHAFEAFASERPRRDGYLATLDGGTSHAIELSVEVDVRDSRKHAQADNGRTARTVRPD